MADPPPLVTFLRVLADLRRTVAERGALLLVEGDRDREALRALGVTRASLVVVNSGRPLPAVVEALVDRGRPVVVLTDWDRKGGHLAFRLSQMMADGRVPVDLTFRRRFARAMLGEITHVQAMAVWAEREAGRLGTTLDHWLGDLEERNPHL